MPTVTQYKKKAKRSPSSPPFFGEPWEAKPGALTPRLGIIDGEEREIPSPEKSRHWVVWAHVCPQYAGENMSMLSYGEVITTDDSWPIITFRFSHASNVPQDALARRVAECVNFCAGIDIEEVGFDNLKALLHELNDTDALARRQINTFWQLNPKTEDEEPCLDTTETEVVETTVSQRHRISQKGHIQEHE